MKVVIATPLYPPEIGGPATYAAVLARELPKQGMELDVVKFSEVRYLPNVVRQIAFFLKMLSRAKGADLIYALDPVSVGWPSYFANLFLKKKFIVKIVGDHIWEQGSQRFGITQSLDAFPRFSWAWHPYLWFLRVLQLRVVSAASRVVVPSEYLKYIVSTWGISPEKISVIYNAVPMDQPGVLPPPIAALAHPLIVSVARLVPWKGLIGLIEAVAIVREHLPHASLAIIGDGPEREALKAHMHEELGVHGVFLGKLPHDETLAAIKNADVFVLNSSYEGLSHTLIEAISLGAPVVATRVGGNGEVIADGENGLLVPVGDTEQLAKTISTVLNDKALREKLTQHAKASADTFKEESMVLGTVKLLSSL